MQSSTASCSCCCAVIIAAMSLPWPTALLALSSLPATRHVLTLTLAGTASGSQVQVHNELLAWSSCPAGWCHPTSHPKPDSYSMSWLQLRVERCGGQIVDHRGLRVQGVLAMTRALGDHALRPYVIADPEVTRVARCQGDQLLLLASDGLWDVMGCQVGLQRCCALYVIPVQWPEHC
jgi:hypothetical protein